MAHLRGSQGRKRDSQRVVTWRWVGWGSYEMRRSRTALLWGVAGWLMILIGGYIFNEYTAGQLTALAAGPVCLVGLVLGVKAFRTRERWISTLAVVVAVYPGIAIPLFILALAFGGVG